MSKLKNIIIMIFLSVGCLLISVNNVKAYDSNLNVNISTTTITVTNTNNNTSLLAQTYQNNGTYWSEFSFTGQGNKIHIDISITNNYNIDGLQDFYVVLPMSNSILDKLYNVNNVTITKSYGGAEAIVLNSWYIEYFDDYSSLVLNLPNILSYQSNVVLRHVTFDLYTEVNDYWGLSSGSFFGTISPMARIENGEYIPETPPEPTPSTIDDLINNINSNDPPDNLSDIVNFAGYLPPGPVDSILNLPLTFMNNYYSAFTSSSCSPVNIPFPYLENKYFSLPCGNTLINNMGFTNWWETIGAIFGGYCLYKYLVNLYKWVDSTLTFRENNWPDWGGA